MVVVEVSLGCCPGPLTLLGPLGYCPPSLPPPCLRIAIPFRSTFPPRFLLFLLSLCFDYIPLSLISRKCKNNKIETIRVVYQLVSILTDVKIKHRCLKIIDSDVSLNLFENERFDFFFKITFLVRCFKVSI